VLVCKPTRTAKGECKHGCGAGRLPDITRQQGPLGVIDGKVIRPVDVSCKQRFVLPNDSDRDAANPAPGLDLWSYR
jgi:hypothetical protein